MCQTIKTCQVFDFAIDSNYLFTGRRLDIISMHFEGAILHSDTRLRNYYDGQEALGGLLHGCPDKSVLNIVLHNPPSLASMADRRSMKAKGPFKTVL